MKNNTIGKAITLFALGALFAAALAGCVPVSDEDCDDCGLGLHNLDLYNFPIGFDMDEWQNDDWNYGDWEEDTGDDQYPDLNPDGGYCDLLKECICEMSNDYTLCVSQIDMLTEATCEGILQDNPQCLE